METNKRQEFRIEIETTDNDYSIKKEFNLKLNLTDREFVALITVIKDFEDKLSI